MMQKTDRRKSKSSAQPAHTPHRGKRAFIVTGLLAILLSAIILINPQLAISAAHTIDKTTHCQGYCLSSRTAELYQQFGNWPEAGAIISLDSGKTLTQWNQDKVITPASLQKLFVIRFTSTQLALDDVVKVKKSALKLENERASSAKLKPGKFTVRQLYQAMLVPSGNDAARAVALAYSYKKYGNNISVSEGLAHFKEDANSWLLHNGFTRTVIADPSGFSEENKTSVQDVAKVSLELLAQGWVKDTVSEYKKTVKTPDGKTYAWRNTNKSLNPKSEYYDPQVKGVKTGSLPGVANLVALCHKEGKDYLIISLGSEDDQQRYESMQKLIALIL